MDTRLKTRIDKVEDYFNTIFLRGKEVICEMCNWEGKMFPKDNRCPNCGSYARTRLIPYALNYFNLFNYDINILHVAPNRPEFNYISNHLNFNKYDRLDLRKTKFVNLVQDLTNTDITDCHYDLIIAWHVLEHIPNDIGAIQEMFRILKPNGKLLVSVPIHPFRNTKTYEDKTLERSRYTEVHGHMDHCRSCGLDYYERFEEIGFNTSTLHVEDLPVKEKEKFGLSVGHTVWLFTKQNSKNSLPLS